MQEDKAFWRFFAYLNLFTAAMLTLVTGDNLLLMFVGWEGVGLCSYALIGFWYQDQNNSRAGNKAFIVNRVGDFGFAIGILAIWYYFGSVEYRQVFDAVPAFVAAHPMLDMPSLGLHMSAITFICVMLFIGAMGKSAQVPLHVWLPDSMEGPTPISALIHAATMVTAGVYMVARLSPMFEHSETALELVTVVGAITAWMCATIGMVQNDIKRVIAYSTCSQLGYMFIAAGVGVFQASLFHLITHAFFKSLLFLCAGSVIHAMSDEQDMRKMGGLWRKIPITAWTMLAATLAISGIPGFAGFFSKDEILWNSFSGGYGATILWVIGWATAGLTAFYMFRLLFMTFAGPSRVSHEAEHHLHESPWSMLGPLVALAILSVIGGYINWPSEAFGRFLEPVFANPFAAHAHEYAHGTELGLMGLSVVIALAGLGLAYLVLVRRPYTEERAQAPLGTLGTILFNKYYVDELYDALFVNRVKNIGNAASGFDQYVVDGGVNGVGWTTRLAADLSRLWDLYVIDGLVNVAAFFTKLMSYPARVIQTGLVQNYAWLIVLGVLIFLGYYLVHFRF